MGKYTVINKLELWVYTLLNNCGCWLGWQENCHSLAYKKGKVGNKLKQMFFLKNTVSCRFQVKNQKKKNRNCIFKVIKINDTLLFTWIITPTAVIPCYKRQCSNFNKRIKHKTHHSIHNSENSLNEAFDK